MKIRTLNLLVLSLALGMAAGLAAAGDGHSFKAERLSERLGVSESQQAQIVELLEQHSERRKQDREQLQESIHALLSPEQAERFERHWQRQGDAEKRRDRRERGERHKHMDRADGKRRSGLDRLDLSEEQKASIAALRETHRQEMQDLRGAHREQLRGVLSEAQIEQLDARSAERKRGEQRPDKSKKRSR